VRYKKNREPVFHSLSFMVPCGHHVLHGPSLSSIIPFCPAWFCIVLHSLGICCVVLLCPKFSCSVLHSSALPSKILLHRHDQHSVLHVPVSCFLLHDPALSRMFLHMAIFCLPSRARSFMALFCFKVLSTS
jgi:hypothetical protein